MEQGKKIGIFLIGVFAVFMSILLYQEYAKQKVQSSFGYETVPTGGNAGIAAERILPVYCVETDLPQIALSFDAAWGNEDLKEILAILEEQEIKATFFMTGGWVKAYPEDVLLLFEAGHELGNHSLGHLDMTTLTEEEIVYELLEVHNLVKELTGYSMQLFRPPYGAYNDLLISTVRSHGYQAVQWDVDSLDWKDYGVQSIVDTVTKHKHLGKGSIILCHNGGKYTAAALPELIENLKAKGYEFVTVGELVDLEGIRIDHEGRQSAPESQ